MRYDTEFTNASGSESFATLAEAAANDRHDIYVRIYRYDTSCVAIWRTSYDEMMWSAIENADRSIYGESYEERCDMEPHDLHSEMESLVEAHIGAIMTDDADTLLWKPEDEDEDEE